VRGRHLDQIRHVMYNYCKVLTARGIDAGSPRWQADYTVSLSKSYDYITNWIKNLAVINYTSVHAAGPNQPAIKLRSDDFMEPRLWSVYWSHYEHAGGVMRPILSLDLRRLSASSQGVRKTIKQHVIEFQSSFIVLNTLSTAATARFFSISSIEWHLRNFREISLRRWDSHRSWFAWFAARVLLT
jgi:hypothetical protein